MTTTKKFGLFQFQSGYRKFYLNSPKGDSRTIINAQTEFNCLMVKSIPFVITHKNNKKQFM